MANSDVTKTESSAEKAYAAAAEAVSEKSVPEKSSAPPLEFPAKKKRARTVDEAGNGAVKSDPVATAKADAPLDPAPAKKSGPRSAAKTAGPKRAARRGAAKAVPAKQAPAKQARAKPTPAKTAHAKAAPGKAAPMANRKPDTQKIKTAPKTASSSISPHVPLIAQLKEIPMDVTNSITDAVSGAQEKAKEAFAKTSAAATEYGEFAKGNVQACVESGKILASGLQELGSKMVADSKSVFETVTADMKALGGVKSPSDLFKLQSEILRRNFDTAIAYSSKNSEAMLKLTNEVMTPLSGRVTLAVDKLKKAA
jgi:hypothetical protein